MLKEFSFYFYCIWWKYHKNYHTLDGEIVEGDMVVGVDVWGEVVVGEFDSENVGDSVEAKQLLVKL